MDAWLKRSKLAWPSGVLPGYDPNHFAHKFQAQSFASVVAVPGGTFRELTRGLAGTVSGTITSTISDIGPVCTFPTTATTFVSYTGGVQVSFTSMTVAAIYRPTSSSNNAILGCINTSTPTGIYVASLVPTVVNSGSGSVGVSGVTLVAGAPYFIACSLNGTTQNWVITNLRTGQIQTAQATSALSFANFSATIGFGGGPLNSSNGQVAAAALLVNTFLSLAELRAWGADPWSFWYPQPEDNFVGVAASGLPPGKQYFDTAQPDPNAGRSIQLRSFEKPGGQILLTGQDQFNPGKQLYDRQPDPQDNFAQWRAFAGWYNLNLIGKDKFNPGQQWYATPDAWLYPDQFARWRSWTGSYNLNLIGKDQLPTGQQLNYLPSGQVPDSFAQWHTWTGSYNLNLIGQDQLPTGKQSYDLPASLVYDPFARWRSWTGSYNLNLIGQDKFNPGQQSYATPDAWLVPERFAQWRSWTGSYNLNLIGQDRFPPGKQWNELPRGVAWLPDSPPQNLVNTLLKSSIAATLPPGAQSWELSPRVQDAFAQWRSWTGSYNLNLIGQDQLPPGAKLYDRQPDPQDGFAQWRYWSSWYNQNLIGLDQFPVGAIWDDRSPDGPTWRVDTIPPNLLPTLIGTPVAIPPGKQLFERPRFFFLM